MTTKTKYRALAVILVLSYGLFTTPVLQEWESAFLLITAPLSWWVIYKIYS